MNLSILLKLTVLFLPIISIECVFNGSLPTSPDDFPFTAVVIIYKRHSVLCSASLIHPRWIVTAAHCFFWNMSDIGHRPSMLGTVQLGSTKVDDFYSGVSFENYILARYFMHPDSYDASTLKRNYRFDIALAYLERPMTMTKYLQPIKVALTFENLVNRSVMAAGFGRIGDAWNDRGTRLYTGTFNIEYDFKVLRMYNEHTFICQGDSGGSVFYRSESSGEYILVGVLVSSTNMNCEKPYPPRNPSPKYYAFGINIFYFLPWIKKVLLEISNDKLPGDS